MDVIRKAFPSTIMSESVIRKVLKTCADFKREGETISTHTNVAVEYTCPSLKAMRMDGGCYVQTLDCQHRKRFEV